MGAESRQELVEQAREGGALSWDAADAARRADPRHANDIWHAFYEARTFMLHGHRQDM